MPSTARFHLIGLPSALFLRVLLFPVARQVESGSAEISAIATAIGAMPSTLLWDHGSQLIPTYTNRVISSTWRPCLLDANWCVLTIRCYTRYASFDLGLIRVPRARPGRLPGRARGTGVRSGRVAPGLRAVALTRAWVETVSPTFLSAVSPHTRHVLGSHWPLVVAVLIGFVAIRCHTRLQAPDQGDPPLCQHHDRGQVRQRSHQSWTISHALHPHTRGSQPHLRHTRSSAVHPHTRGSQPHTRHTRFTAHTPHTRGAQPHTPHTRFSAPHPSRMAVERARATGLRPLRSCLISFTHRTRM